MRALTEKSFAIVSAILFGMAITTSFAGPEPLDHSKDKVVMTQPAVCDPRWFISIGGSVDPDLGSDFSNGLHETFVSSTPRTNGDNDEDDFTTTVDVDIRGRDWDDAYND